LALGVLIGSCVGGDSPTDTVTPIDLAIQPALIPSAANGSALPIHRIHTVVTRSGDGAVLREQRFDVSPTAATWTVDVVVPVSGSATDVIVYVYLINVASDATEAIDARLRSA
jgi:hypothetical protein